MSKLLINEPPLQVLPSLAVAIGLNEAIFLQQLHYWLTPSAKYKPHYREYEGITRPWIYNTYHNKNTKDGDETGWQANFPFWSVRTIKRIGTSLNDKDLIITTDQFNDHYTNRTLWYTIDYENLATYETLPESANLSPSESDNLAPSESDNLAPSESDNLAPSRQRLPETTTDINGSSKNSLSQSEKDDINTLADYIAKNTKIDRATANEETIERLKAGTVLGYEIAKLCSLIIAIINQADPKTMRSLFDVTISLFSSGKTPDDLKSFNVWWYADTWQGRKGQSPTPALIASYWGQFETTNAPSSTQNGTSPSLSDAELQRYKELVAAGK